MVVLHRVNIVVIERSCIFLWNSIISIYSRTEDLSEHKSKFMVQLVNDNLYSFLDQGND